MDFSAQNTQYVNDPCCFPEVDHSFTPHPSSKQSWQWKCKSDQSDPYQVGTLY